MAYYKRKQGKDDKSSRPKGKPRKPQLRNTERDNPEAKISNDPNWYFTDARIADQVSSFSFNQYLGEAFNLGSAVPADIKVPTVCSIMLNPSAGWTDATTPNRSGINSAGFKLYTMLSARNAKTTNYAPQDVIMLMLALGNLLSFISWCRRFFGFTLTYNQRNRAYAKFVCQTMGLDFDDFIAHRADYLIQFNYIINEINKIPFPANVAYFDKCRGLYDDIYLDADTSMAQSYVLNPYSVWLFDEQFDTDGSGLKTVQVPHNPGAVYFGQYLTILQNMVDALLSSTTLNYIYSDVLAYAEKQNVPLNRVDLIESSYSKLPVYSDNFLLQWKNASILGAPLSSAMQYADGMHVTADNDVKSDASLNCVKYTPQFLASVPWLGIDAILDFPNDTPDVTARIEATRYTVRGEATLDNGNYYSNVIALGDHYVVNYYIYNVTLYPVVTNGQTGSAVSSMAKSTLDALTKFTLMPFIYYWNSSGTIFDGVYGDLHFYTTVGLRYLLRVDDIAIEALFELR